MRPPSWRRPALLAAAVLALAPVLVVAGPAGQAQALATVPAPVAFTGSYVARSLTSISLPETAVLSVRAGASAAALGSGATSAGVPTIAAGLAPSAGSVALGGLGLGLMIGDGVIRVSNLLRSQDDQLVPLSDMLINSFKPNPAYVPEAGAPASGGWTYNSGCHPAAYQYCWNSQVANGTGSLGTPVFSQNSGVDLVRLESTVATFGPNTSMGSLSWATYCRDAGGSVTLTNAFNMSSSVGSPEGSSQRLNWTSSWSGGCTASAPVFERIDLRWDGNVISSLVGKPSGGGPPPVRALEMRATCSGTVVTGRSGNFVETDAQWPAPPSVTCPGAVVPSRVQVWEVAPNGDAAEKLLSSWDAPALDPVLAPKPGATMDLLRVYPDSSAVSCFSQPGPCAQWWTDPAREQNFRCTYGGQVIALTECALYRPSFDTSSRTPYADPSGEVPPPSPSNPTGDPQVGTPTDEEGRQCWPNGWGVFNPAEWVLRPVGCALTTAFVPTAPQVDAARAKVEAATYGTALGEVQSSIANIGGAFSVAVADGSCEGLGFDFGTVNDRFAGNAFHPFWTCDGIGKAVSDVVRPILVAGLWLGGLGSSIWVVAGAFGWRL
jgi:hypothetical protein